MGKFVDITGQKYGRLTAIKKVENNVNGKIQWLFKCDCGKQVLHTSCEVKSGHVKSCGCWKKDHSARKTHGQSNNRIYQTYYSMKRRCYDNNPRYLKYYRDKGITVCDEWLNNPQAFFDWAMMNGYDEHLTLDRIDCDKGYSPDNCRFITQKEQTRNMSKNVFITIDGKRKVLTDWAKEYGILPCLVSYRMLHMGLSGEEAVTRAVKRLPRKSHC